MQKKAMLIVPHQDDETNLAANIIDVIKGQYDLYVLYSSLDADPTRGKIRKQEAIDACAVWRVYEDHIIFLNYPDTPNKCGHHFFTDDKCELIDDLKSKILELKPSIIFATDFDYHSDHRMISLAFDISMGQILMEYPLYCPTVLKGFCYETAFYSVEDYKASCPDNSVSNVSPLSNPSYEWDKRVSIHSLEKAGPIWRRKAYKALEMHKSQYAILHARSIVNQDNVFWLRRTDNLLCAAMLTSSIDGVEKIRDFLVLDTDDIITANPREIDYSKACCMLGERDFIQAEWDEPVSFDRIIIHGSVNNDTDVETDICIMADNKNVGSIKTIRSYGRDTEVLLGSMSVKKLTFEVVSGSATISEIEVLNGPSYFAHQKEWMEDSNIKQLSALIDLVDVIGYKGIVFLTRLKRKITNTFHGK